MKISFKINFNLRGDFADLCFAGPLGGVAKW